MARTERTENDPPVYLRAGCPVKFSFCLPDTISHVHFLRKAVSCLCESLDVSRQDRDDIEAIIGELATNVVRHAQSGSYLITLEFSDTEAVVVVTDKGQGFSPEKVAEPGTMRADRLENSNTNSRNSRIGGFGLPLVRSLADELNIHANLPPDCGTTFRAIRTLQPIAALGEEAK